MLYSAAEIATNLGINPGRVEFVACYPFTRSMTEVVFLLLESGGDKRHGASKALHHEHLGPRQLAAQLAALIASPTSALQTSHTLSKCHALKIFAGRRPPQNALATAEAGDSHLTASTLSESDADEYSDASDGTAVSEEQVRSQEVMQEASTSSSRSTAISPRSRLQRPLKCLEGRLATFANWPHVRAFSPLALATAGFYRLLDPDSDDMVKCAYCRLEMIPQIEGLPPALLHKQKSPSCPIVMGTANETVGLTFRRMNNGQTGAKQNSKCKLNQNEQFCAAGVDESVESGTTELLQSEIPACQSIVLDKNSSSMHSRVLPLDAHGVGSKGPSSRIRQMYASRVSAAAAVLERDQSPGLVLVKKEERELTGTSRRAQGRRITARLPACTSRETNHLKLVALGSSITLETSGSRERTTLEHSKTTMSVENDVTTVEIEDKTPTRASTTSSFPLYEGASDVQTLTAVREVASALPNHLAYIAQGSTVDDSSATTSLFERSFSMRDISVSLHLRLPVPIVCPCPCRLVPGHESSMRDIFLWEVTEATLPGRFHGLTRNYLHRLSIRSVNLKRNRLR